MNLGTKGFPLKICSMREHYWGVCAVCFPAKQRNGKTFSVFGGSRRPHICTPADRTRAQTFHTHKKKVCDSHGRTPETRQNKITLLDEKQFRDPTDN